MKLFFNSVLFNRRTNVNQCIIRLKIDSEICTTVLYTTYFDHVDIPWAILLFSLLFENVI